MLDRYYKKYAVAYIIGNFKVAGKQSLLPPFALTKSLNELTTSEQEEIILLAKNLGVKTYHFKKTDALLPRVQKTLGFLRGVYFETLIDVGSGRGVFLLPFLEAFPYIKVTSVEMLTKRVNMLSDMVTGGVENLTVVDSDVCNINANEFQADVVTLLEVLEHIPRYDLAIKNAVKMAKKYIIITVPSKEDDNPEHIHLLTKPILTKALNDAGVTKIIDGAVSGHLFMVGFKNEL